MKYGLIIYNEQNAKWRNGDTYLPTTVNIGDYIQSIAARQFLPHVDCFIEREKIRYYEGEPVKVIMNGWWRIFDGTAFASESIQPLYTSYHISYVGEVTDETIQHLKKHQPIGCRDGNTLNFLLKQGVDAYFSACLTLTLGKTYPKKTGAIKKVLFSDFHPAAGDNKQPGEYKSRLQGIISDLMQDSDFVVEHLEHSLPIRQMSHEDRFALADKYLQQFSEASLVVTSRLHAALPCLGMGVPVLFCFDKYDKYRFPLLLDLMNYAGLKDGNFVCDYITRQKFTAGNTAYLLLNPTRHIPYIESLTARVETFVKQ